MRNYFTSETCKFKLSNFYQIGGDQIIPRLIFRPTPGWMNYPPALKFLLQSNVKQDDERAYPEL